MSPSEKLISISRQTLSRLPYYARCISRAREQGEEYVSASSIAEQLGLHEVQVRKDLASVSAHKGVPKRGFRVEGLLQDIRTMMGSDNANDAILVGAGSLGRALLQYNGFEKYGVQIAAAFDASPELQGQTIGGKPVFSPDKIGDICRRLNVHIGIIAVPAAHAQAVADQLVESGIWAIWNFAPVLINAPKSILVQSENMAASLVMLSQHLMERLDKQERK